MTGSSEVEKLILAALEQVQAPDGKNIVDAGLVTSFQGSGTSLTVLAKNPGLPEPILDRIQRQISAALRMSMPHLTDVQVDWRSQPVGPAPATGTGDPSLTIGHVVAVGSGKGGVGKSTIAASIAYGLRHRGQRVGIMDADVYGPSIPHMLGVSDPPRVVNNRYQPPIVDGMPIMSMGFLVPPEQAVIWRGPMLHKAVSDFLFRVEWGSLDVLVVDLPPGTGDIVLSLSQQMPVSGGVIVCTPQEVALLDARKALAMLNTVKIPCLGVVENMSYFVDPRTGSRTDIFGHGGAQRWSEQAGVPFLGAVPLDIDLRIHGDNGQVRQNFAEDCPSRGALLAIADRLLAQLPQRSALAGPAIEVVE